MQIKTCFSYEPENGFPIKLQQTGKNRFVVLYGLQRKAGLCYADAARELGCAIMHSLACEGQIEGGE